VSKAPVGQIRTAPPTRWGGVGLLIVVGLLQLHLPHYLGEVTSPAGYALYPGPVLVATAVAAAAAAVAIGCNWGWGWILGIGVSVASWVLYVVQETVGLPGLSHLWWEPTRLLAVVLNGALMLVATRELRRRGR
jgi:hypothetical protein